MGGCICSPVFIARKPALDDLTQHFFGVNVLGTWLWEGVLVTAQLKPIPSIPAFLWPLACQLVPVFIYWQIRNCGSCINYCRKN